MVGKPRKSQIVDIDDTDFSEIPNDATISLYGRRRTGKSNMAKVIIRKKKKQIRRVIVFCGNPHNEIEWTDTVPQLFVHGLDIAKLQYVKEWQAKRVAEALQEWLNAGHEERDFVVPERLRLIIVFDDTGSAKWWMNHPLVIDIINNGRHYGILLLSLLQKITQYHPDCRDGMDLVGIMQTNNQRTIDRVFSEYIGPAVIDKQSFYCVLQACTSKKGEMLLINNMAGTSSVKDKLKYRTNKWPPPKRSIPFEDMQEFHKLHFVSEKVKHRHNKKWYGDKPTYEDSSDDDLHQNEQERQMNALLDSVNGPAFGQTFDFNQGQHNIIRVRKRAPTTLSTRKKRMNKYD